MFGVLFAAAFLLVASGSSVVDNVEILLKLGGTTLSSFKADLEAEDAKKVVQVFDEMVKISADLHQAKVLLKETYASAELEVKVQVLMDKFDRVIPHAAPDRTALVADILDKNKGIETMKKLLNQIKEIN